MRKTPCETAMITEKDIPAGFELLWENGITIIVRPDDAEAVREFLSRPFPAQSAEEYRGRGRLYRIHRGEDKPALLVKQYLRGGVFRGILKDRFLSALRFVSELYLTGVAAKQSVPTFMRRNSLSDSSSNWRAGRFQCRRGGP